MYQNKNINANNLCKNLNWLIDGIPHERGIFGSQLRESVKNYMNMINCNDMERNLNWKCKQHQKKSIQRNRQEIKFILGKSKIRN
jgi:hypothetical protein